MEELKLNSHLAIVFEEILPALTEAGIKYWALGGVGVAGVVGKFIRENQDVDTYVLEDDFPKVEPILKKLCEKHGGWDADDWSLRYSMLKNNGRPKFDIYIKHIERFSVFPVYPISGGVEFRVIDSVKLSEQALVQELRTVDGFKFFSPPKEIIAQLLRSLAERYIKHYNKSKPIDENSKHIIDARAIFTREELDELIARFNEKAKTVAGRK